MMRPPFRPLGRFVLSELDRCGVERLAAMHYAEQEQAAIRHARDGFLTAIRADAMSVTVLREMDALRPRSQAWIRASCALRELRRLAAESAAVGRSRDRKMAERFDRARRALAGVS